MDIAERTGTVNTNIDDDECLSNRKSIYLSLDQDWRAASSCGEYSDGVDNEWPFKELLYRSDYSQ